MSNRPLMLDITSAAIGTNFSKRQTPERDSTQLKYSLKNDADTRKESPDSHYFPYFFAY